MTILLYGLFFSALGAAFYYMAGEQRGRRKGWKAAREQEETNALFRLSERVDELEAKNEEPEKPKRGQIGQV